MIVAVTAVPGRNCSSPPCQAGGADMPGWLCDNTYSKFGRSLNQPGLNSIQFLLPSGIAQNGTGMDYETKMFVYDCSYLESQASALAPTKFDA